MGNNGKIDNIKGIAEKLKSFEKHGWNLKC